MQVLNIPVSAALLKQWRQWLAPPSQPFFLTQAQCRDLNLRGTARASAQFTPEQRDTNTLWAVSGLADQVVWLSRAAWQNLPPETRRTVLRAQVQHGRGNVPSGRDFADLLPGLPRARFLWQQQQLTPPVLARLLAQDAAPCQRASVPPAVWASAVGVLPRVQELAGTFPSGSAGNCFGAVMGAAGVVGAEHDWVQRPTFEAFLDTRTRRLLRPRPGPAPDGGTDDAPGTLLVWRSADGALQHAAVTVGGGWAFHKPSQTWQTARVILPTPEIKKLFRTRGQRLSRFRLIQPG